MKNTDAQLQFTITPTTVFISTNPDQASYANISVSIENSGPALNVSSIAITLPLQLAPASSLNSITPVAGQMNMWNFNASQINNGEFDATPQSGAYVVMNNGDSWLFTLQMATLVSTITQPSATVTTSVNLNDGTSIPASMNVNIDLATATILSFYSQPANITPGQPATLNWQCEKIDYCTISPGNGAHLHPSQSLEISSNSTTIYTLYAYGDGVILSAQWGITVGNPQIFEFGIQGGASSENLGSNITFEWKCNDYTQNISLTNNGGVPPVNLLSNGNTPQMGSVTVGPLTMPTTFTFTAVASNPKNFDERQQLISINDVSATFTATPDQGLWEHDAVTLQWKITSASSVDLSPGVADGPSLTNLSGSVIVNPDSTTTYTLTVQGFKDNLPTTLPFAIPLNVQNVTIDDFEVHTVINHGEGNHFFTSLEWNVTAQVAVIDNGIGNINPTGSGGCSAQFGISYTLTAGTHQNPALHSALT